jgi:lipopolysaccharide transport system permease protein
MRLSHFRELTFFTIQSNLKAESNQYAFSYIWWILEPMLHFIILYIVFGIYLGSNENNYIAFLFCGLVPWFWFNKSISNGLDSIINGKGIIRDTYIPKYFFPTVSLLQSASKEFFVLVLLIVILFLSGIYPSITWLSLPLLVLLQFLLIASLVYLVAIIVPYFSDFKHIISTLLQLLMFASGTFYDYKIVPEAYQELFLLNPMALLITMYRDILIYHKPLEWGACAYIVVLSLLFFAVSFYLYRKLDRSVTKVLFR